MIEKYKTIIVGAGISGLTLANELISRGHQKEDLLVVDQSDRTGGLIRTTKSEGYITEWGPEGLRGGKPGTVKLFSYINSKPVKLPSTIPARYIVHKGKLRRVPHGLLSAIFTSLVPFFGKLRLLLEPFIKKKEGDETMEEFIKRRFGKGIYPVVDAVVSGIYGGSPSYLSVTHAFPYLKQMEIMGGSVIKGGIKQLRIARKNNKKQNKPRVRSPFLIKPQGGMQEIIDGLSSNVNLKFNFEVTEVKKINGVYVLRSVDNIINCDNLVLATGVNETQKIDLLGVKSFEPVPESLVSIVSLGFDTNTFPHKFDGFGFLSPSKEDRFVLGVLFTSQLFPHTSPEGEVLLRVYVGGIDHREKAIMEKDELIDKVFVDLKELMGITEKPIYSSVQRHAPKGISQIIMGHEKILDWKNSIENKNKNIYLSGIGWKSIAVESLINEAVVLAGKININ
ncbi:MAG: protoporphyrinogen oxidase [Candidatus Heimdallarchaeota archaeon]|nr:protoporphyrinogen oxidase [Candidatus Heimdallarchaeota archaeon]